MRKMVAFWIVAFLAFLLVGCELSNGNNSKDSSQNGNSNNSGNPSQNENENNAKTPTAKDQAIKDYYPFQKNARYFYEGTGNEFASYTVYFDYIEGKKAQQRVDNGGTVMANIIELKDGKITKVYSRGEAYYRENLLKNAATDGEILLMEPLKKGTTWTLKDSRVRTITNVEAEITTPAGAYKAIEVTTEGSDGKTLDYYAKGVGLVKTIFTAGDSKVESSLSKIDKEVPFKQMISFFYPNIDDGKIYFHTREVSFFTNDITRKIFAEEYKKSVNQLAPVFSKHTNINSLYLNNDQQVYIDLNQSFIDEMNAGSGVEAMILQSVANTFGGYYQAEKVYLTIDNKFYESGHFVMKKGEFLKVDLENSLEVN